MNTPTKKIPSLQELANYKNADVVERFSTMFGIDQTISEQVFEDMKTWLWLAAVAKKEYSEKPFMIDGALIILDEMWHNFVLFTKDYGDFCERFFGNYLHHTPTTRSNSGEEHKYMASLTQEELKVFMMNKLRWQYELTMEKLGKEVFIRWYQVYAKNYSKETLAKLAYEKVLNDYENARKLVA